MVPYIWEDFNSLKVKSLGKSFNLDWVVSKGKDEFEKQLLLKDWIAKTLPRGNPNRDYAKESAVEIISDGLIGRALHCTEFAFVYLQCSIALGWYSRKLSVDTDHKKGQEEMHHGIVDIWTNKYKKWYVVDPMNNLHFEKDGIPLNSLEIRQEYLSSGGSSIVGVVGNYKEMRRFNNNDIGFGTPSNYFWFFISLRNNFFERPGLFDTKALLWIDAYNENKIWYKGGGNKGLPYSHPMYNNQFIETNDVDLCFPSMRGL